MTADAPAFEAAPASRSRRLAAWLYRRPRAQLRLLLLGPLAWMVIVYLGSLFFLLLGAFWDEDPITGRLIPFDWTIEPFVSLVTNPVNVTYLTGFTGDSSVVYLTDDRAVVVSDGRYAEQLVRDAPDCFASVAPMPSTPPRACFRKLSTRRQSGPSTPAML